MVQLRSVVCEPNLQSIDKSSKAIFIAHKMKISALKVDKPRAVHGHHPRPRTFLEIVATGSFRALPSACTSRRRP